jgi:hypothetical protein
MPQQESTPPHPRRPTGAILVGAFLLAGIVVSLLPSRGRGPEAPSHTSSAGQIEPAHVPPNGPGAPSRNSARNVTFPDDLQVVGISIGGADRAYLIGTLEQVQNHIVNDLIGNSSVSVTYCDRTHCARAFTGGETGRPLALRPAGFSAEGGMILDSGNGWYFQKTGQPVSPAGTGPFPYRELPSDQTTWGEWKRAHPETSVVYFPCLATEAWAGVCPSRVVSAEPSEPVAGVVVNGLPRAYVLRAFDRATNFVIHDSINDVPVTVAHCVRRDRTTALVPNHPDASPITFAGWDTRSGAMVLESDGRRYQSETGAPCDGDSQPLPFRAEPLVRTTWGAWYAAHPDTTVYVGNLHALVHIPTVDDRTQRGLAYLQRLLPFAPALAVLLVLLARRFTRKAPNHINAGKNP